MNEQRPQDNARTQDDKPVPVIGLLGAPGAGKSTVARVFAELGCGVVDADRLSHEAIQSEPARQQLRAWWGGGVFRDDGSVDRAAVGRIVFNDKAQLQKLEALLHPLVHAGRARERQRLTADPDTVAIIEDTPLLLESGMQDQCDALVFVDCPREVRLRRLSETRGWDEQQTKKREQNQAPLDTKRQTADYVISNDQDLSLVREQARRVLNQLIK